MTDRDLIQAAYEDTVRSAYRVFFESYTNAQGSKPDEDAAEANLQRAFTHARHIRDRALALLSEPS